MAVFPGQQVPKTIVQGTSQPQAVHKETGELFILVRDDVAANGKLYIAPVGAMTSMRSIKPEQFKAEFEWYVPPKERPLPVREAQTTFDNVKPMTQETVEAAISDPNIPQVDAGGPIGPFVPFAPPELASGADEAVKAMVTEPKKARGRPKGAKNKRKTRKT